MIVTDRANRPFVIHLSGGCVGLTDANRRVGFRTSTNLSCLRQGDQVLFRDPTLGGQSCFVREVEPAAGPYASDENRNIYRDYENRPDRR